MAEEQTEVLIQSVITVKKQRLRVIVRAPDKWVAYAALRGSGLLDKSYGFGMLADWKEVKDPAVKAFVETQGNVGVWTQPEKCHGLGGLSVRQFRIHAVDARPRVMAGMPADVAMAHCKDHLARAKGKQSERVRAFIQHGSTGAAAEALGIEEKSVRGSVNYFIECLILDGVIEDQA